MEFGTLSSLLIKNDVIEQSKTPIDKSVNHTIHPNFNGFHTPFPQTNL
jgi:hypothetical protein